MKLFPALGSVICLTVLFTLIANGQTTSLAESCQEISKLRDLETRDDYLRENPDKVLMSIPGLSSGRKDITAKDFAGHYIELLEERNLFTAGLFKYKLFNLGMQSILTKKEKYLSLISNHANSKTNDSNNKISYCLASRGKLLRPLYKQNDAVFRAAKYDDNAFQSFIIISVENALRAHFLLERKETLTNERDSKLKQYPLKQTFARKDYAFEETPARLKIKSDYGKMIDMVDAHLNALKVDSGTILSVEKDVGLNYDSHLKMSDFAEGLVDIFTKSELQFIRDQIENQPTKDKIIAALTLLKNRPEVEKRLAEKLKTNSKLWNEAQWAIQDQVVEYDEAAAKVCKSDGKDLHHYDDLVTEVFRLNHLLPLTEITTFRDIGAYCYLKENYPDENRDIINPRSLTAFSLVGIGSALKWMGWLRSIGTVSVWAGEAILGYESYDNFVYANNRLAHTNFVSDAGYLTFADHIEKAREVWSSGVETTMVPAFAVLGMISYSPIRSSIPEIQYKLNAGEKVTLRSVRSGSSRLGLSHYQNRLLKHKKYQAHNRSLWERYEYFRESPEFQEKLFQLRKDKKRWLGSRPFLGLKIKDAEPISALHRSSQKGRQVITMVDDLLKPEPSEATWKALDDIIGFLKNAKREVNKVADLGYTADKRLGEFEKYLKQYKIEDFMDARGLDVPKKLKFSVVKDGKTLDEKVEIPIDSYPDLEAKYRETKLLREKTFANTPAEVMARDSNLDRINDEWAWQYRSLLFARSRLSVTEDLSSAHKQKLDEINDLLNDSNIEPAGDANAYLLEKEIWSEKVDLFRSANAKRRILGEDYDAWQAMTQAQATNASLIGKSQGFVFSKAKELALLGGTLFLYRLHVLYTEAGPLAIHKANLDHKMRNLQKITLNGVDGFIKEEKDCAQEGRFFAFMLCYNTQANLEVNHLVLKKINLERQNWLSMRSEEYEAAALDLIANDTEIKTILRNYAYKMLRLRKLFRGGELFDLSNRLLEEAISDYSKTEFARIIDEQNPGHPELSTRILEILSVPESAPNRAELIESLLKKLHNDYNEHIEDFTDNIIVLLNHFLKNKGRADDSIKNKARLTRYLENNLNGITENLMNDRYYRPEDKSEAERFFDREKFNLWTGGIFEDESPRDISKFEPEDSLEKVPESEEQTKDDK